MNNNVTVNDIKTCKNCKQAIMPTTPVARQRNQDFDLPHMPWAHIGTNASQCIFYATPEA